MNSARRTSFILYENDLATYRRLRDEDSGWLTYLWTFEYENIPERLEEEMHRLLEHYEDYPLGPDGFASWQAERDGIMDDIYAKTGAEAKY